MVAPAPKLAPLTVRFHSKDYEIPAPVLAKMESGLDTLRKAVSRFPLADLHVHIRRHPSRKDFHVTATLHLPGEALFTGERDPHPHPAFKRCLRKLTAKLRAYEERMNRKPAREKMVQGTQHDVYPAYEPDVQEVEVAVRTGDYPAFRQATSAYRGAIERRIGQWVQRYPKVEARLGRDLLISQMVEEVFLLAFERFPGRPHDRLGNWLEGLIDDAIGMLVLHPSDEDEFLRLVGEEEARASAV